MKKMGRPKSDNAKKKVLSIRVPDELYSQMLAYAEKYKMTTTDLVLSGVEILLSEQKKQFIIIGGLCLRCCLEQGVELVKHQGLNGKAWIMTEEQ